MNIAKTADDIINRITMYRLVVFGLLGLLAVSGMLAQFKVIRVDPLGLLIAIIVLSLSCFFVNKALAHTFNAAVNSESWLITALILVCILRPATSWSFALLAAVTGAVAMASKYVITWRGSHVFNPAAFGAFVVSVTGLLSASWWIATPVLLPTTALLALIILRKQRRFMMFFVFAIAALLMLLIVGAGHGQTMQTLVWSAFASWPLVFFGSVMLTEPMTLPPSRHYQLLVAAVVGALFTSQLHFGVINSSPHTVLLIGNVLAVLLAAPFGGWLKITHVNRLAPDTVELVLTKPKNLQFVAGQYMEWTLPHSHADSRGNRRTFSIASAPTEDDVRIAVRVFERSSSYKRALSALQPGERIRAANVGGEFTVAAYKQKLLFIAGGIGITPFRSMVAQMTATKTKRDIVLIYLASSKQHFVYKNDFSKAANSGVRTEYIIDKLADDQLQKLVPDFAERQVYVSGPPAMVRFYVSLLTELGISRRAIRTDRFSGY